jgi:4-hydroxy-tetrahydrodipicolinate synthase
MTNPSLQGVYVPLVTPYDADGAVDRDAAERVAKHVIDQGVAGIVALATTGEMALLDEGEKRELVEMFTEVCARRGVTLIVGAGNNNTRETVKAVHSLDRFQDVTAALCVVPYYLRPSQAGILSHFKTIAAESPVPIILYNIPYRTGVLLEPDGLLELASTPNVIGVKHAVGSIDAGTLRILAEAPPDFAILGGDDLYLFPLTLLGASGAIAASAHVCTRRFVEMIECGIAGKVEDGRMHHEALLPVVTRVLRGAKSHDLQNRPSRPGLTTHAERQTPARRSVSIRDHPCPRRNRCGERLATRTLHRRS